MNEVNKQSPTQHKVKAILHYVQGLNQGEYITVETKNQVLELLKEARVSGDFSQLHEMFLEMFDTVNQTDIVMRLAEITS